MAGDVGMTVEVALERVPAIVRPMSFVARLVRCVVGLAVCGLGVALIVAGDIGLGPWDVLHEGISEHTGLAMGTTMIVAGATVLLLWIPLRVRPGLGTVLNAVEIGATVDLLLPHLPEPDAVPARLLMMVAGVVAFGVGTGLYIGAGLGPGPRDGLMTGLSKRTGVSLRIARTGLELAVLVAGWALGGSVGVGTAVFAISIGPLAQFFVERFGTWGAATNGDLSTR